MSETLMTTEAATPSEGAEASTTDTQAATVAVEGVQEQVIETKTEAVAEVKVEEKTQIPESYEFSAPEGVPINEGAKEAYAEVAKELGLTQAQAQAAFEKLAAKGHASQVQQLDAMAKEWAEKSTSDSEFGGVSLQENLSVAKKALDAFGSPELRSLLNESGLGNHPEMIRLLYRAGRAVSEDKFVGGSSNASASKASAKAFYSNTEMNP